MARRSIWEQLRESTEGPTVTLQLPREVAEALLQQIAGALEVDDGGEMDDPGMDDVGAGEDDFTDGLDDGNDDEDIGFSAGGDEPDDLPAGDDDEDEPEDDGDDDKEPPKKKKAKESSRPETALGESRLGRYIGRRR